MSPVKPSQIDPTLLYFVTTTTARHLHFFEEDVVKRIIVDNLNFLRVSRKINLFAFVIMPNHIHIIARLPADKSLADCMRDFKKYTARQIYHHYLIFEQVGKLQEVEMVSKGTKHQYRIWESGYDAREIFTAEFLAQKMEYIHCNPCRSHWNLADSPEQYPWSSARFYFLDRLALIDLDDVRELFA